MSEGIGLSARELQGRALRGASWSTLSSMLALPLAIGVSVVLARVLGPHEFARFAYLGFLVPLLYEATDFGYGTATSRSAAQAYAAGDIEATGLLAGKALGWNAIRLVPVTALVLALTRPSLLAAVAVVSFLAFAMVSAGAVVSLNAQNRIDAVAKAAFVQALAAGLTAAGAALAGASGTTVWALAWASGIVAIPLWLRAVDPALRRAAFTPRLPRDLPPGFWRYGITALAASVGGLLVFSRSEIVILEWLEQEQALAVFALAFGIAQRLTTPVDTMLGPLVLALSGLGEAHPERLREGFERALRLSCAAVAGIAGSLVVATAFAAPVLFGEEYPHVGLAFAALAVASLVQSAAHPYTALAYARGRPGIALRALAVALVVDVGISIALIPPFGIWGAVAANAVAGVTAIALIARAAAEGGGSLRRAGVPARRLALLVAGSSLLACVAALPASAVHPLLAAGVALVVGSGAFVAGARVTGGLLGGRDAGVLLAGLPRRPKRAASLVAALVRAAG
jgi:O-antigen/teichoic acid export membrane protein